MDNCNTLSNDRYVVKEFTFLSILNKTNILEMKFIIDCLLSFMELSLSIEKDELLYGVYFIDQYIFLASMFTDTHKYIIAKLSIRFRLKERALIWNMQIVTKFYEFDQRGKNNLQTKFEIRKGDILYTRNVGIQYIRFLLGLDARHWMRLVENV